MKALLSRQVVRPLTTIFAIQTLLTTAAYTLPVVIPSAAPDIGIYPDAVGFFVAGIYGTAMVVGLISGELLTRLGPTRVFQLLLLLAGAGALVLGTGAFWAAVLAAVLIGASSGPMNPAGSTVLEKVTTPSSRALVFSLKQCATPAGGMVAGTLLPLLTLSVGWHWAVMVVPAAALILVAVAPFGALGGSAETQRPRESITTAMLAAFATLAQPAIRAVTLTGFGLAVCQMGLATYLVVYLWSNVGYSPEKAGFIFAVLHMSGIASRVVLGLVADRLLAARLVLVWIAITLSACLALLALLDDGWPEVAVFALIVITGASGNGWVGLYFAELARLSPAGKIAEVAAGSQFLTYLGIVCGPLLIGVVLGATGSFAICFTLLAILSLVCGAYLIRAAH